MVVTVQLPDAAGVKGHVPHAVHDERIDGQVLQHHVRALVFGGGKAQNAESPGCFYVVHDEAVHDKSTVFIGDAVYGGSFQRSLADDERILSRAEPQSLTCGLLPVPVGGGRHSAGRHREADAVACGLKRHIGAIRSGDGPALKDGAVQWARPPQIDILILVKGAAVAGEHGAAVGQGELIVLLVFCCDPAGIAKRAEHGAVARLEHIAGGTHGRCAEYELGGTGVIVVQVAGLAVAGLITQHQTACRVAQLELAAAADGRVVDGGLAGRAAGNGHIAARVHGEVFAAHGTVGAGDAHSAVAGDVRAAGDSLCSGGTAGDDDAGAGRDVQVALHSRAGGAVQHHVHAGRGDGERLEVGSGDGEGAVCGGVLQHNVAAGGTHNGPVPVLLRAKIELVKDDGVRGAVLGGGRCRGCGGVRCGAGGFCQRRRAEAESHGRRQYGRREAPGERVQFHAKFLLVRAGSARRALPQYFRPKYTIKRRAICANPREWGRNMREWREKAERTAAAGTSRFFPQQKTPADRGKSVNGGRGDV